MTKVHASARLAWRTFAWLGCLSCAAIEPISFGALASRVDAGIDGSGGGGGVMILDDAGLYGHDEAGPCAVVGHVATSVPLDIFILLDQSGSMAETSGTGTKWSQAVEAVSRFVDDPTSAGTQVALQYFSLPLSGQTVPTDTEHSCAVFDYALPEIPMAALPDNARAIEASMIKHTPSGPSPTYEALVGATTYAVSWANAHPTHRIVIVMATDAGPHLCMSTEANTEAAAKSAFTGTPSIATYVIGLGTDHGLDVIAAAGGTGKAYLVDVSDQATDEFVAAMQKIRAGDGLPCAYPVPAVDAGKIVDFEKVNLDYTPGLNFGSPDVAPLYRVNGQAKCPTDRLAWYYDDNAPPQTILLCSPTCQKIKQDIGGQLVMAVGCQTRVIVN